MAKMSPADAMTPTLPNSAKIAVSIKQKIGRLDVATAIHFGRLSSYLSHCPVSAHINPLTGCRRIVRRHYHCQRIAVIVDVARRNCSPIGDGL